MATPGILYVTMQPQPGLLPAQFHEWYNNEHGPTRLRLPQLFSNGLRFRATDGQEPTFLASYDVPRMAGLLTPTYTDLRANRSPREAETIGQVDVKRYFYDLVHERAAPGYVPIEKLPDAEAAGIVVVAVQLVLKDVPDAAAEVSSWYEHEHIDMLAKIPGWLRSRWFRASTVENAQASCIALHEFAAENGLGGPEHKAGSATPWRNQVFEKFVAASTRRLYSPFYTFGPAPRDLESLKQLPKSFSTFTAPDGKTSTVPGSGGSINSYITTNDALSIPYVLEGNSAPDAPTVAFCNSLLTSLHMWDPFIELLKKARPDLRLLRYDQRGRHAIPQAPTPATPDRLADDLLALLDALRIPKLHALVGVSMGGVTALNFSLRHPKRLDKLVACDFNVTSSAANTQAWKERVAVAEQDDGAGISTLAGQTVARWFHPATMENKPEVAQWMTDIVAGNSVEGFRYSCQALWDYDLKPLMGASTVPSLLVVGDGDAKGALVKAMQGFSGTLGEKGAELAIVPLTGHLPMSEDPEAYWEAIRGFL